MATRMPADKWRVLGIALEIPPSTLDGCEEQNPQQCYETLFQDWERRSHPPKWTSILQALQIDIVGKRHLADILSRRLRTS